jgi:hypothetical protein
MQAQKEKGKVPDSDRLLFLFAKAESVVRKNFFRVISSF